MKYLEKLRNKPDIIHAIEIIVSKVVKFCQAADAERRAAQEKAEALQQAGDVRIVIASRSEHVAC